MWQFQRKELYFCDFACLYIYRSYSSFVQLQGNLNQMSESEQVQPQGGSGHGPDFYEVEEILKRRETSSGPEYYIRWKNYPDPKDYTWEPVGHLQGIMHLVEEFNQKNGPFSSKKKMKQEDKQQKPKSAKKMEEAAEEHFSDNEVAQVYSDYGGEKDKKKKQKKSGFYPKLVKVNIEEEREPQRKKLHTSLQHTSKPKHKHKVKTQISKYMAPVIKNTPKVLETSLQKSENSQNVKQFWFNSDPYQLDSIYKHIVQKDQISYLCNIVNKNGDLACVTVVGAKQLESINCEMEKKYILGVLFDFAKMKESETSADYLQFEKSWKDS